MGTSFGFILYLEVLFEHQHLQGYIHYAGGLLKVDLGLYKVKKVNIDL